MPSKRFRNSAAFSTVSLLAVSSCARAATVSSEAPGNIFVEKQPLHFSIQARGKASLSLREYSGRVVWTGSGASKIDVSIPAQMPGWYQLTVNDESDPGETRISLGVVLDRKNAPLPLDGRVCADAASAWLLSDETLRRPFARVVRLAGIPWVRERLSWSASETQRGKIAWTKNYENTAAAFAGEGVHVLQMWHDTPEWTRFGREKTSLAPDDLRDVYRFTRAAATHYTGFGAWEAWNEPDHVFWPDLSDRFAGMQKAAYFGFKDGNPRLPVTYGGFAFPNREFVRGFFANGGGEYSDIYNWHRYADPAMYPADLRTHRAAAKESGANAKTWWMTEAGIALPGTQGEGSRLLSDENTRKQARFLPRNVAMSLAAGNAKHFFFVLPDYVENGTQFGLLQPDLTPNPGFLALSAAANILGMSDYAGTVSAPAGITARVFDTKNGRVVVAWSETPQTLILPAIGSVTVRDMFGAASTRGAHNGRVSIKVGPDAVYLSGTKPQVAPPAIGTLPPSVVKIAPRVLASARSAAPSRVVAVGFSDLPVDKIRDAYLLGSRVMRRRDEVAMGSPETATTLETIALDTPLNFTVQAYNFEAKKSHRGSIALQVPSGWRVSPAKQSVQLAPMERRVLAFRITPSKQSEVTNSVRVVANFAREKVSPSISRFSVDPSGLAPTRRQRLDWTLPSLWNAGNTSPVGHTQISRTPVGALRYDSTFDKAGDRWSYPRQNFATPQDFSAYDGIAFDLKMEASAPGSVVRLMLTEAGGATYMSGGVAGDASTRRVVILFRDLEWSPFAVADANHRLDLDKIIGVQLGLNTTGDAMNFETENFELVKFSAAPK